MQILSGGAPCQQIDSEEDDDQEAEAEDEVSCPYTPDDSQASVLVLIKLSSGCLRAGLFSKWSIRTEFWRTVAPPILCREDFSSYSCQLST